MNDRASVSEVDCRVNAALGRPLRALRDWGLALVARGGKAPRKKAAVAVARELAVVMHRLWVSGEDYRPYPQGEPGPLKMIKLS
jgi:hypothetical protein